LDAAEAKGYLQILVLCATLKRFVLLSDCREFDLGTLEVWSQSLWGCRDLEKLELSIGRASLIQRVEEEEEEEEEVLSL
jgi:hypothetical protein